jgi:DNA invertase Pin-like site-specific DNA recombinase
MNWLFMECATRRANNHPCPVQWNRKVRDLRLRMGEGRARAMARGVKMGRRTKLTDHQKREAIKRRDKNGETLRSIGRSYNVSAATISRLQL